MPGSALRVNRLYLALHTRDDENADSVEDVRLFLDGDEIVNFGTPPPGRGLASVLEASVDVAYEDFRTGDVAIGISGVDPWGPRSAFLWGRLDVPGDPEYAPLAENLDAVPLVWISQDIDQGVDRWSLYGCPHLGLYDSLAGLVLYLETAPDVRTATTWWLDHAVMPALENAGLSVGKQVREQLTAGWKDVRLELPVRARGTGSAGPLELSVRGYATDFEDQWVGPLVFHATLTRRGRQEPASAGAQYLAHFYRGFLMRWVGSAYRDAFIVNASDDAWKPRRVWLFGLGANHKARTLGVNDSINHWCSQDPHISETISASQLVLIPQVSSVLDD